MQNKDIRWIQRFNNFRKALKQLTKFIEKGKLNELEQQGLIQSFEYTTVILYGSRAKGNFKPGSDIDLTLKGKDLILSTVYKIELELDNLFLPYTFDISIFKQISNSGLVEHIQRAGVVFHEK